MNIMDPIKLIDSQAQFDVTGPGIYMIYCPDSKKAYIGQSNNIHRRWKNHKAALNNRKHYNRYLQRTFDKYNGNLCFYILENTENRNEREEYWASLIPTELLLNEVKVGGVHTDFSRAKIKPSQYKELSLLYKSGTQVDRLAEHFGISRRMLYKYLKMIGESRVNRKSRINQ